MQVQEEDLGLTIRGPLIQRDPDFSTIRQQDVNRIELLRHNLDLRSTQIIAVLTERDSIAGGLVIDHVVSQQRRRILDGKPARKVEIMSAVLDALDTGLNVQTGLLGARIQERNNTFDVDRCLSASLS